MSLGIGVWENQRVHRLTGQSWLALWWGGHCSSSKGPLPPGPCAEWSPTHAGSADPPTALPGLGRSPLAPKAVFQVISPVPSRPRVADRETRQGGAPCPAPRSHRTESCLPSLGSHSTGGGGGGVRVVGLTPGRGLQPHMPPQGLRWQRLDPVQPLGTSLGLRQGPGFGSNPSGGPAPACPPEHIWSLFRTPLSNGEPRIRGTCRWILAWRPIP